MAGGRGQAAPGSGGADALVRGRLRGRPRAREERDGLPTIARLFRTAAEAGRIHAEGHLRSLEPGSR